MISKEAKARIISNNKKITLLLKDNENCLRNEGLSPPIKNYSPEKAKRIEFPAGYIRVNEVFQEKYHLKDIVRKPAVRKNIAYSLQLSDFYNYIYNRFNIWGSVETMLLKNATINLVSILEAFVFECANNICSKPDTCGLTKTCKKHFSKEQRNNAFEALKRMKELKIVSLTETQMNRVKEIIDYRNRIHIRLATENEFIGADFTPDLYEQVIHINKKVSNEIYSKGCPMFYKCD